MSGVLHFLAALPPDEPPPPYLLVRRLSPNVSLYVTAKLKNVYPPNPGRPVQSLHRLNYPGYFNASRNSHNTATPLKLSEHLGDMIHIPTSHLGGGARFELLVRIVEIRIG